MVARACRRSGADREARGRSRPRPARRRRTCSRRAAAYAELGIGRIATRAGISRTAFYFYFRDKRDLLVRLTEEVTGQLMAAAEALVVRRGGHPPRAGGVGALYREHAALLRAVVEVSTYDEEVAMFWRGLVGRFVDATRARIEAEQAAGRALPGDAQAMASRSCG